MHRRGDQAVAIIVRILSRGLSLSLRGCCTFPSPSSDAACRGAIARAYRKSIRYERIDEWRNVESQRLDDNDDDELGKSKFLFLRRISCARHRNIRSDEEFRFCTRYYASALNRARPANVAFSIRANWTSLHFPRSLDQPGEAVPPSRNRRSV